jgi:hypothetical protein
MCFRLSSAQTFYDVDFPNELPYSFGEKELLIWVDIVTEMCDIISLAI